MKIFIVIIFFINSQLFASEVDDVFNRLITVNLNIQPSEITSTEGKWSEYLESLYSQQGKLNPPLSIWNDEIEYAYISLLSKIKKEYPVTYNKDLFLFRVNKTFCNFSTLNGLKFVLSSDVQKQYFDDNHAVNYLHDCRNIVYANYMFRKELENNLKSRNIKLARIKDGPVMDSSEINIHDQPISFNIKYFPIEYKEMSLRKTLKIFNQLGGMPETFFYNEITGYTLSALEHKKLLLVLIDELPAYFLFPSFNNKQIHLVHVIPYKQKDVSNKSESRTFNILVDKGMLVFLNSEIYNQIKNIFFK